MVIITIKRLEEAKETINNGFTDVIPLDDGLTILPEAVEWLVENHLRLEVGAETFGSTGVAALIRQA